MTQTLLNTLVVWNAFLGISTQSGNPIVKLGVLALKVGVPKVGVTSCLVTLMLNVSVPVGGREEEAD